MQAHVWSCVCGSVALNKKQLPTVETIVLILSIMLMYYVIN